VSDRREFKGTQKRNHSSALKPWARTDNIIMETKEQMFFILLALALCLPIVMRDDFVRNRTARYSDGWSS
jgi:hypothetical protein